MNFSNLKKNFINLFGKDAKHRYFNITNLVFILVIFIASFASLFHVRGFWLITNSSFWATSLAISTGLGIIGSMLSTRYTWMTYISFFVIIIMELIGNIFDAFLHISTDSIEFQAFKDLTEPLFNLIYSVEPNTTIPDIIYMRWISCIEGAFIPILVAVMFHMWMVIRDKFDITLDGVELPLRGTTFSDLSKTPEENEKQPDDRVELSGSTEIPEVENTEETIGSTEENEIDEKTQETPNPEAFTGETIEVPLDEVTVESSITGETEEIVDLDNDLVEKTPTGDTIEEKKNP